MKRIAISLIPCLFLAACITSPKECQDIPSDPATETFATSLNVNLSTMNKTQLGDYTKDIVPGTGAAIDSLEAVRIVYSAYLKDGTLVDQVTDSTFTIDLSNQSTLGLADGMFGMQVGGQRMIVSPSELAQGACGRGAIPGNSTIVYLVSLLGIGGS